MEVSGAVRQL